MPVKQNISSNYMFTPTSDELLKIEDSKALLLLAIDLLDSHIVAGQCSVALRWQV
jgi:hypothetical protein